MSQYQERRIVVQGELRARIGGSRSDMRIQYLVKNCENLVGWALFDETKLNVATMPETGNDSFD